MSTARKKTDSKRPAPKSKKPSVSKQKAPSPLKSEKKAKPKPGLAKSAVAKATVAKPTKVVSKPAKSVVSKKVAKPSNGSKAPAPKMPAPKAQPSAKSIAPAKPKPVKQGTPIKAELAKAVKSPVAPKATKIHPPAKAKAAPPNPIVSKAPPTPVKVTKPEPVRKKSPPPAPPPSNTKPEIVAKIRSAQAGKEQRKDLAQPTPKPSLVPSTPIPMVEKGKDRLILMVRDSFWLHAHWDITRHSVERARVSIAENWHTAKPILRMIKIDDTATTSNAETVFRDIEIHGGVRNWYMEIETPGTSFKLLMGYITSNGRFYELARSNTVTMPMPGGKEASDDHWADIAKNAEKIFAMSGGYSEETNTGDLKEVFEERLKRTMDTDVLSQFGSGAEGGLKRNKQFHFDVDAELVVFGTSNPDAHVNVGGEPVKVRNDGSFSVRLQFPDKRQVLRVSAKSRDGVEEQTVVIAVERNTKVMEPLSIDAEDM